jgi:hypothetical protein
MNWIDHLLLDSFSPEKNIPIIERNTWKVTFTEVLKGQSYENTLVREVT